jgi:hypothetical protein
MFLYLYVKFSLHEFLTPSLEVYHSLFMSFPLLHDEKRLGKRFRKTREASGVGVQVVWFLEYLSIR